jgi:hypothetical protein
MRRRRRRGRTADREKRGPKPRWSDAEIVAGIRTILAASPFQGEGYRKIRARLAHGGLAVSGKRVLRVIRAHSLLARYTAYDALRPLHSGMAAARGVEHRVATRRPKKRGARRPLAHSVRDGTSPRKKDNGRRREIHDFTEGPRF